MIDLMLCRLKNLLFFNIPLLYCYTNLNPSIICCLSSGDMSLFFDTSISSSEWNFLELSDECNSVVDFFETSVILSAILFPIKSTVASTVF